MPRVAVPHWFRGSLRGGHAEDRRRGLRSRGVDERDLKAPVRVREGGALSCGFRNRKGGRGKAVVFGSKSTESGEETLRGKRRAVINGFLQTSEVGAMCDFAKLNGIYY